MTSKWWQTKENFGKMHKFWSCKSQSRSSSLESRIFWWCLHLKVWTRLQS